jgi:hypothetical protein
MSVEVTGQLVRRKSHKSLCDDQPFQQILDRRADKQVASLEVRLGGRKFRFVEIGKCRSIRARQSIAPKFAIEPVRNLVLVVEDDLRGFSKPSRLS